MNTQVWSRDGYVSMLRLVDVVPFSPMLCRNRARTGAGLVFGMFLQEKNILRHSIGSNLLICSSRMITKDCFTSASRSLWGHKMQERKQERIAILWYSNLTSFLTIGVLSRNRDWSVEGYLNILWSRKSRAILWGSLRYIWWGVALDENHTEFRSGQQIVDCETRQWSLTFWWFPLLIAFLIVGKLKWLKIKDDFDFGLNYTANIGNVFYFESNHNAPNGKIVRYDIDRPVSFYSDPN